MRFSKKIISIVLVLVALSSILIGCGLEEEETPAIIPEQQLFEDSYELNSDITNLMTYKNDYLSYEYSSSFDNIEMMHLFNHPKIQVDNMPSITLGITTVGEVVELIDEANDLYVKTKTDAVIAERQAIIDAEYEEAKAKAEAKGKTYDKAKKEVRTDDIHFEKPYTYKIQKQSYSEPEEFEYQEKMLTDPATYSLIKLVLYKYGIPYVQYECQSVSYLYNTMIAQESKWIVNGVQSADCSHLVNQDTGAAPEYVDVDLRNKAAKKNIVMSGNIAFGGDGFTWDSLMKLCSALDLNYDTYEAHTYKQTSDKQFTYYTIKLAGNIFEYNGAEYVPNEAVQQITFPGITMVATFDPLSQVCINWTIDMYNTTYAQYSRVHDLAESKSVDVHEFHVDTNDYILLRQTINDWIDANAVPTQTVYAATTKEKKETALYGVVDSGLNNIDIEIYIDGELYQCLEILSTNEKETVGDYIKMADYDAAHAFETQEEIDAYINKHKVALTINCCVLDEKGNILGIVLPGEEELYDTSDDQDYYIARIENREGYGISDVKVVTKETANTLMRVYAKTYQLDQEQAGLIADAFDNGLLSVRASVDKMFEEAEQKQQEANKENNKQPEEKKTLAETATPNTTLDLNFFTVTNTIQTEIEVPEETSEEETTEPTEEVVEEVYDLDELLITTMQELGFEQGSNFKFTVNETVCFNGVEMIRNADGLAFNISAPKAPFISAIHTDNDALTFVNGIKVGMSDSEVIEASGVSTLKFKNGYAILKSASHSMIIAESNHIVTEIYLMNNSFFEDATISLNGWTVPGLEDELTPFTQVIDTKEEIQKLRFDGAEFDLNEGLLGSLVSLGYDTLGENSLFNDDRLKCELQQLYNGENYVLVTKKGLAGICVDKNNANAINLFGDITIGTSLKDVRNAFGNHTMTYLQNAIAIKNDVATMVLFEDIFNAGKVGKIFVVLNDSEASQMFDFSVFNNATEEVVDNSVENTPTNDN